MNAAVLAVMLFAFARALRRDNGAGLCAPLALLAAGAAGNFTDRLVYGPRRRLAAVAMSVFRDAVD